MKKQEIVVSGIRPTGFLHLGNYIGALTNFIKMQEQYSCFFFVADLHSLTTHPDTTQLKKDSLRIVAEHLACGIQPNLATLFIQSQVPEITELYCILNSLAYKGELEKTVTFKEKIRLHTENINVGLLTYPVLQAADILIHRGVKVPVGKDQEQHLEMTRNFAQRFNNRYGHVFPEPQAFSSTGKLIKILSLDGKGKMSKSDHQLATLYLTDSNDAIYKKIMKAKTDSGPQQANKKPLPCIENLFTLLRLAAPPNRYAFYQEQYNTCDIRYGDMKKELAEYMIAYITPIRERTFSLLDDEERLIKIVQKGNEKARASAAQTMKKVKKAMHLIC